MLNTTPDQLKYDVLQDSMYSPKYYYKYFCRGGDRVMNNNYENKENLGHGIKGEVSTGTNNLKNGKDKKKNQKSGPSSRNNCNS